MWMKEGGLSWIPDNEMGAVRREYCCAKNRPEGIKENQTSLRGMMMIVCAIGERPRNESKEGWNRQKNEEIHWGEVDSGGKRRENRLLNGDARTVSREKIQSFESVEQKHPEVSRGLCLHDAPHSSASFSPPIPPSLHPSVLNFSIIFRSSLSLLEAFIFVFLDGRAVCQFEGDWSTEI